MVKMKKHPFIFATLTVVGIFLFFLLVVFSAGFLRSGSVVSVGNKIGVLEVEGTIVDSRLLVEQILNYRERNNIKAVVVRIDSPGGGVGPSQEIYAELKKLADVKPLIISMGSVAASGGYYLAVAGDKIFANPGTITGSIGVIMSFPNYQDLMGKVGIHTEVVKSGTFKDIGSSSREFTAADRELLQRMIDDVHLQFVEAISVGRKMSLADLQPYVDGRIFTGRQAKALGLIDELGTFHDAVQYAAKTAGIDDDPDLVYPDPVKMDFIDRYLQGAVSHFLGINLATKRLIGPQYLLLNY
ncbi:signal peptide peptidase A. Serine peptidase. MEROPS family S49 [Desulfuromusa kysingii]|uniref:Signal peptide peptidase A. Serine peptidase. MEROPS family S49 n=1 Tax=Desulfuromusa kysingii TaxID=37625 RepID=A0A1H3YEX9_9BACT|nr:signal peptide peptidase SppA [Desulfuromusa kysingii]SEA09482.1 signal peptide peptidase A. Serine peptidase. MEROPS family S49 [Desulfuromusa kysingii]